MIINLVPDFLAVTESSDPIAAYAEYFSAHEATLRAYWRNYVIEPEGPHFQEVIRTAALAPRDDLRRMVSEVDVVGLAQDAVLRCQSLLGTDTEFDVVLMVGVGAANAGELVVDGRGIAFVCLEHFTGAVNHQTHGLGLDPELISLWLAHEITHVVRYTSPRSRSEMRSLISDAEGLYSYWETGRRASLKELVVNEGLAVQVSRAASPGHAAWDYFGYGRKEFARVREAEGFAARAILRDLDRAGLGLRLRYLSGGMSDAARTVAGTVIPERAGYFVGTRMVEPAIAQHGLEWAVRASADEILGAAAEAARIA
jgi:hypothetical protein